VYPVAVSAACGVLQELAEVKEASEAADKAAVAEGKTLPPHDISGIPEDVSELSVAQLQVWPPTPEPACFDQALRLLLVDPHEQCVHSGSCRTAWLRTPGMQPLHVTFVKGSAEYTSQLLYVLLLF
jgi:hypothetical protein